MEDEGADFHQKFGKIDTKSIITIQALFRGALVRKWMRDVKLSFTEVVNKLEKNPSVGVEWKRDSLCLPKVSRRRHNKLDKVSTSEERSKDVSRNVGLNKPKQYPPSNSLTNKNDEATNEEVKDDKVFPWLNTVETQTSFIEISNSFTDTQRSEEHVTENFRKQLYSEEPDIGVETAFENYRNDEQKPDDNAVLLGHHSMETGPEIDGTDTARSQSVQSELDNVSDGGISERLTGVSSRLNLQHVNGHKDGLEGSEESRNNSPRLSERLSGVSTGGESPPIDTRLNLQHIDGYKDGLEGGRKNSPRSISSEEVESPRADRNGMDKHIEELEVIDVNGGSGKSSQRSTRSNKHVGEMTEVEEFRAIDSDRSRHSGQSGRSGRSNRSDYSDQSARKTHKDSAVPSRYNIIDDDIDGLNVGKEPTSDRSTRSKRSHQQYEPEVERKHNTQHQGERPDSARSHGSQRSNRSRGSHRSGNVKHEGRDHSPVSDRSERSLNSQRSDRSEKSSRSVRSDRSERSETSRKSEGCQRSHRSKTAHSPRSHRGDILKSPRPSSVSPVPARRRDEGHEKVQPFQRSSNQDSTTLTNVTSIWDSFNSCRESHELELPGSLPEDPNTLRDLRKNISMELLWVQQAIDSRKNYLKLKNKM